MHAKIKKTHPVAAQTPNRITRLWMTTLSMGRPMCMRVPPAIRADSVRRNAASMPNARASCFTEPKVTASCGQKRRNAVASNALLATCSTSSQVTRSRPTRRRYGARVVTNSCMLSLPALIAVPSAHLRRLGERPEEVGAAAAGRMCSNYGEEHAEWGVERRHGSGPPLWRESGMRGRRILRIRLLCTILQRR